MTLPVELIWALGLRLLLGLLLTDELIVGSLVGVLLDRVVVEAVDTCELLKVLVEEADILPDSDSCELCVIIGVCVGLGDGLGLIECIPVLVIDGLLVIVGLVDALNWLVAVFSGVVVTLGSGEPDTDAEADSDKMPVGDDVIVANCDGVTVCLVEGDELCSAVCVFVRDGVNVFVDVCVTDGVSELIFDAVGVISELGVVVCVCVVDGDGLTLGLSVDDWDALVVSVDKCVNDGTELVDGWDVWLTESVADRVYVVVVDGE